MKVKCEMILNTDTNDYDMSFHNLSNPGEAINYAELKDFLQKIFKNVDNQIEEQGVNSTDNVLKVIH